MKDKKDKKGLNKPLPPSLEESEKKVNLAEFLKMLNSETLIFN
jgi:hypothetical protein